MTICLRTAVAALAVALFALPAAAADAPLKLTVPQGQTVKVSPLPANADLKGGNPSVGSGNIQPPAMQPGLSSDPKIISSSDAKGGMADQAPARVGDPQIEQKSGQLTAAPKGGDRGSIADQPSGSVGDPQMAQKSGQSPAEIQPKTRTFQLTIMTKFTANVCLPDCQVVKPFVPITFTITADTLNEGLAFFHFPPAVKTEGDQGLFYEMLISVNNGTPAVIKYGFDHALDYQYEKQPTKYPPFHSYLPPAVIAQFKAPSC